MQYRINLPCVFGQQDDLFSVLGKDRRPDHRWLIAGPARSGSSFHVDPNCTSAWNATISGRKKWIMFPPGETPPGVHPSEDGLDLAAPVSITEWFLNFYEVCTMNTCRGFEFFLSSVFLFIFLTKKSTTRYEHRPRFISGGVSGGFCHILFFSRDLYDSIGQPFL